MNNEDSLLPPGFAALEPYLALWSAPTASQRDHLRGARGEAERLAFYNSAKDLLPTALAYLDQRSLRDLNSEERRLMLLMLNLAHVSLAVELQGPSEASHSALRALMPITRASADRDT